MGDPPQVVDLAIELGFSVASITYGTSTFPVGPGNKEDHQRLVTALKDMIGTHPAVGFTDREGQVILHGTDEIALDHAVDHLKREFGSALAVGLPQVAYREVITKIVEHDYTHKKQSGGSGQFARIKFRVEPNLLDEGFVFASEVIGGNVPGEYIAGVERGVRSVMGSGPLIGFPIVDVKFVLTDGAYHDVDSSVLAFEIAGRAGFREALQKADPKILEPIMRVEVVTPEDYVGDVIGDLNSRRGQIRGTEARGTALIVDAMVPLAATFGYDSSLRSMSHGSAQYTMTFDHYEQVPHGVGPFDPDDRFPPAMAMRA